MKKNEKHFSEETTLEELDLFIQSLALKQFTYQSLIQAICSLEILEYYDKVPSLPEYQPITRTKTIISNPTTNGKKIGKPLKWEEVENEAMIEGYRKFGIREHKKVYEYHRELFEKHGHNYSKMKDHFRTLKTQEKYASILQSIK